MVREIEEKIKNAKEELELLIFRYGATSEKVIELNNKIDSLLVDYYNENEKLKNYDKIIYIDFNNKKVI